MNFLRGLIIWMITGYVRVPTEADVKHAEEWREDIQRARSEGREAEFLRDRACKPRAD